MLVVWLFQTGEPMPGDDNGISNPMRCLNLSSALLARGHKVVVWTAAFSHQSRDFRRITENPRTVDDRLTVVYIPSTGYQASVGLARLLDHLVLGLRCYMVLRKSKLARPNVAFIGFPPIEFAFASALYLKRCGIPYVVDPKDMWPEFFSERLPSSLRPLARAIFWPMKVMRDFVFRNAFSISTISDGFLQWALDAAGRVANVYDGVFPLTSAIKPVSEGGRSWRQILSPTDVARIGDGPVFLYAGTLTHVLDIQGLRIAAQLILTDYPSARLVVCGDGSASADFHSLAAECPNVICLGRVSRDVVSALLARAAASLIPYRNYESMAAGVPNKFYDAMAAGVPIISCLSGDVERMIDSEAVGLRYLEGDGVSLHRCIIRYLHDPTTRDDHAKNAFGLYTAKFKFDVVYERLSRVIEAAGRRS
jgi:glycosyltransferase involved in cell wall biosynthesis